MGAYPGLSVGPKCNHRGAGVGALTQRSSHTETHMGMGQGQAGRCLV